MVSTQDSLKTVIDTQDSVNDQQLPTSAEQNDQKPEVEDPFQDENYLKKLKVYAEKLKISLDDVQSRRLSKNQLKRLVRNQTWQVERVERRKIQREKRKIKKAQLIQQNRFNPIRFVHMKDSPNKVKIVISLEFESYMKDRELQKTFKQVQRCYAYNRRFSEPCQLYLTSVNGRIRDYIDGKEQSIDKWDVNLIEHHWYDHFKTTGELDKIVYLTSDSQDYIPEAPVVKETRGDKIYIIGGLVDHNFYKFLTFNIAKKHNVATGKLPIDKYVKMSMTKVLAVNHVFELMLNASAGVSWKESFFRCLPQRKIQGEEGDNSSSEQSVSEESNGGAEEKEEDNDNLASDNQMSNSTQPNSSENQSTN